MTKTHAQTLHAALAAKRRAARLAQSGVVWFDGHYANTATVDEDGTPNLLRLTWNLIDTRAGIWWEHRVYCLRAELPAVAKWIACGYNYGDWCLGRFPLGLCIWSRGERDSKALFQMRTAKYQHALECGKLAQRRGDIGGMQRWLARFGEPPVAQVS